MEKRYNDCSRINFSEGWYFKRLDRGIFTETDYESSILHTIPAKNNVQDFLNVMLSSLADESGKELGANEDVPWLAVNLPHTARLEAMVTAKSGESEDSTQQWQGICWYCKRFTLQKECGSKKLFIHFEAAMNIADVWLNGKHIMHHMGGFLPFTVDISDATAFEGENIIAVRLDNSDNTITGPKPLHLLDFNMYHGIYRNMYLVVKDRLHITDPVYANKPASGGVFITYPIISENKAEVEVKTHILNEYGEDRRFEVQIRMMDAEGNAVVSVISDKMQLPGANDMEVIQKFYVENPRLWSVTDPYLYRLVVEIIHNGTVIDCESTLTGIRKIEIKKEGFWLNGEKMVLRGANRHQEYPYIGYALPDRAHYRDAKRIKEAGFDYIRLSHYPHASAFMDACDELGLLVMNCIPGWQYFGGEEFIRLQYQNCRDMIRRDRNHPCILLWEVSINETKMPEEFINEMQRIAHEEYPGEQCYTCGWQKGYDVFGQARQHGGCHGTIDSPCVITEYGDWEYYAQNDGFNQENWANLQPYERNSRQLRGYGEVRLLQQALNYQEAHNDNRSTLAFADSIWVMFDYNRGYAGDIEASGIMDITRIPKFSYYFFKSQRDADIYINKVTTGPMVYIANYWTKNSPRDVRVFSNCEEVALYINGKLIEKRTPDNDIFSKNLVHPPITFALNMFEEGELRAEGYINGKKCAEHVCCTPKDEEKLVIYFEDEQKIEWEKNDIFFVYARIEDKNGTVVTDDECNIYFDVIGASKLIGQNPVKAEAGIATILLQIYGEEDKIEIKAECEGLKHASRTIEK